MKTFDKSVSATRAAFILTAGSKWVNGTEITFFFMEKGGAGDQDVVRKAFRAWKALGIGLSFKEVKQQEDAVVRIGFDHTDGSWSYVGRDVLSEDKDKRTMNFGWSLTEDSYGMTTALHEIGHTLGFEHEHQSPFAGIEWKPDAVYAYFKGDPNFWKKSAIDANILQKLPRNKLQGSQWDAKSIMQYEFEPGLINKPEAYQEGIFPPGIISKNDKAGIRAFYPPISKSSSKKLLLDKPVPVKLASGKQMDVVFKAPSTGKYTFQTTGELDTVMVISELVKSKREYLSGDDDSGTNKNAKIRLPLIKGRSYIVNLRVIYAPESADATLVVTAS